MSSGFARRSLTSLAGIVLALVFGGQTSAQNRTLLAAEATNTGWRVVSVDALSLASADGHSISLGSSFATTWAWSPTSQRIAVGNGAGVAVIGVGPFRLVREIRTGVTPEHLEWLTQHVLVAVTASQLTALDPASGHVLWRRTLPSSFAAVARWRSELLFVLEPAASTYGTATFATVNTQGELREVALDQIHAGEPESGSSDQQGADPGLAVDPEGVAYIVGGGDPVARIDLRTLAASYSPTRQLALALHGETGPSRVAAWVGDGLLAISGVDEQLTDNNGTTTDTLRPVGMFFINTRTWTTRLVDPTASAITATGGDVLAYGAPINTVDSRPVLPTHGHGVAAYDASGTVRYRALAGQPLNSIATDDGYAYLTLGHNQTAILRLQNGRRIATAHTAMTTILLTNPPED